MKIQMGGVPEHFNFPFQKGIELGIFQSHGIDLEWNNCGGGTGQMLEKLENGDLDAAVLLSEGLLSGIINGAPIKLVRFYVDSPLTWGLHVGQEASFNEPSNEHQTFAISRYKSGSHLMSFVCEEKYGLKLNDKHFEIIQNIDGAIENTKTNPNHYFLWEKYTTQPYVDQGIFKRIGEVPTPWPCFALAVNNNISADLVTRLNIAMKEAVAYCVKQKDIVNQIAKYYHLKEEQVSLWYQDLKWTTTDEVPSETINKIINFLVQAESISPHHGKDIGDIIYNQ